MEVSNNWLQSLLQSDKNLVAVWVFLTAYAFVAFLLVFSMARAIQILWAERKHYLDRLSGWAGVVTIFKKHIVNKLLQYKAFRWWWGKRMTKLHKESAERIIIQGMEDAVGNYLFDQAFEGKITEDQMYTWMRRVGETSPLKGLLSKKTLEHRRLLKKQLKDLRRKKEEEKHRNDYRKKLEHKRTSRKADAVKNCDIEALLA